MKSCFECNKVEQKKDKLTEYSLATVTELQDYFD